MDTLYDCNLHTNEHPDERDGPDGKNGKLKKEMHSSTFDLIPVLTSKRMRDSIKNQIKAEFDKISK